MSLRRSIAVRLTLLFAIVATLVLAALGVAIYVSARHDLVAQDFVELENKVALIRDLADNGPASTRGKRLAEALGHHPDIAFQVWDMNFDSDTNVIEVAVRRLRAKIDDGFEPKLIRTVRGMGYVLEEQEDE